MSTYRVALLTAAGLALSASGAAQAAVIGGCKFDTASASFAGTVEVQARCLLRKVRPRGNGADVQPIPDWLARQMGQPVGIGAEAVRQYLAGHGVAEADIGGVPAEGGASSLRYFVIHDTSSPEIAGTGPFPGNIDAANYSGNRLTGHESLVGRVHLIISRDGRSRSLAAWGAARARPATKLEQTNYAAGARKLFAHVENIQPRLKPPGSWAWKAPEPGFAPAQEQRLALAYIVASVQAGRWLIPAYHFNIDEGLPQGHDDPQGADLASWAGHVAAIAADMGFTPK